MLIRFAHCDPEVNQNRAVRGTNNIRRLDIAVNNPRVMDSHQRAREAGCNRRNQLRRKRLAIHQRGQRRPLNIFSRDEGLRSIGFNVNDVGNPGGANRIHGRSFTLQATARVFVGGQSRMHKLEGNSIATLVLCKPHGTRTTRTQLGYERVATDLIAFIHPFRLQGAMGRSIEQTPCNGEQARSQRQATR